MIESSTVHKKNRQECFESFDCGMTYSDSDSFSYYNFLSSTESSTDLYRSRPKKIFKAV